MGMLAAQGPRQQHKKLPYYAQPVYELTRCTSLLDWRQLKTPLPTHGAEKQDLVHCLPKRDLQARRDTLGLLAEIAKLQRKMQVHPRELQGWQAKAPQSWHLRLNEAVSSLHQADKSLYFRDPSRMPF